MTGWRIGYAAAPAELVSCMTRLQENIVACAPLASQHALVDVLNDPEFDSKEIISKFASRRDCIVNAVKDIPQLKMDIPVGTFYAFIDVSKTGLDANEFAYGLLESKHVAVVPGSAYGECCKNYVRIAFTLEESKIIKGFERIKEYVESLQK